MTAQTATYGMDYLNHAQTKDALRWIRKNALNDLYEVGELSHNLTRGFTSIITPCHQFAASVIGRLYELLDYRSKTKLSSIEYHKGDYHSDIFFSCEDGIGEIFYLHINPFHGMTMPDGSPRTSCTREEFEEWKKELDA